MLVRRRGTVSLADILPVRVAPSTGLRPVPLPGRYAAGEDNRLRAWRPAISSPAEWGRGTKRSMVEGATGASHLARLEIDARIDPGIGEVGDQVHDEADQGEDIEIGEHDRIVALNERVVGKIAEAVE